MNSPISFAPPAAGVHAVLDIGSNKIACLIARLTADRNRRNHLFDRSHRVEILGYGLQRSGGVKSGTIADINEAEKAVRRVIDLAERSARMRIEGVLLSMCAGRLRSEKIAAEISMNSGPMTGGSVHKGEITKSAMRQVLKTAYRSFKSDEGDERLVLHAFPTAYVLDGAQKVRDPMGMVCNRLGVELTIISADRAPFDNLELCVNRAHLSLTGIVAAPYASGLATLLEEESLNGATCIDMGGGTTSVSIFQGGEPVFATAIAIGGHHVTADLARCLAIGIEEAERFKILHGTARAMERDAGETISATAVAAAATPAEMAEMADSAGAAGAAPSAPSGRAKRREVQIRIGEMSAIIRPRLEETFELVRERIERAGFSGILEGRVVLTGGASQLTGMTDLASSVLGANCRLGRPLGMSGLPQRYRTAAFSAVSGLALYPQSSRFAAEDFFPLAFTRGSFAPLFTPQDGLLSRMGHWLKESF